MIVLTGSVHRKRYVWIQNWLSDDNVVFCRMKFLRFHIHKSGRMRRLLRLFRQRGEHPDAFFRRTTACEHQKWWQYAQHEEELHAQIFVVACREESQKRRHERADHNKKRIHLANASKILSLSLNCCRWTIPSLLVYFVILLLSLI